MGVEYCNQPVCLCLSVCEHISGTAGPIGTKFCSRGSVLLRWHCAMLSTSVFMDHVTFGRNRRDATKGWQSSATAINDVAIPGRSLMSMNGSLFCYYTFIFTQMRKC